MNGPEVKQCRCYPSICLSFYLSLSSTGRLQALEPNVLVPIPALPLLAVSLWVTYLTSLLKEVKNTSPVVRGCWEVN